MNKILSEVLPGFQFKEKCVGLKEFAKKYGYTYESAKTNWKNISRIHLEKFDRQLIKIPNTNPSQIYIYELPSEKNSDLPGEIWKQSSRDGILVSNLGRLHVLKSGLYTYGLTDSKGYKRYGKHSALNNKQLSIHREVLMAFNPIDNMQQFYVDHIDGNRQNNKLENLRWVTPKQNTFYKDVNQQELHDLLNHKIAQYGYDHIKNVLSQL